MGNVRFKLNLKGLNELMKSGEMQSILNDAASRIASASGDGYEVEAAHPISFVAIASVYAGSRSARKDNNDHKTLQKTAGSVKL